LLYCVLLSNANEGRATLVALQIPHLTYCEEVTFDRMRQLRESLKADLGRRGIKLSYMPFLIKAASQALHHYPVLNSSITEGGTEMVYHSNHNIGIAMDTSKGLIVPVIRQVQQKSILDIAVELGELQEAAAKGTLTEAQLTGGTFSLSNIGSVGGTYAAPVVVLPQVAIGALGRLQMVPRYVNKRGEPADFESIER
jgi:2-oxoisovalerate dehydrogenase E2 component (dihydrolipoyl transacylase)